MYGQLEPQGGSGSHAHNEAPACFGLVGLGRGALDEQKHGCFSNSLRNEDISCSRGSSVQPPAILLEWICRSSSFSNYSALFCVSCVSDSFSNHSAKTVTFIFIIIIYFSLTKQIFLLHGALYKFSCYVGYMYHCSIPSSLIRL